MNILRGFALRRGIGRCCRCCRCRSRCLLKVNKMLGPKGKGRLTRSSRRRYYGTYSHSYPTRSGSPRRGSSKRGRKAEEVEAGRIRLCWFVDERYRRWEPRSKAVRPRLCRGRAADHLTRRGEDHIAKLFSVCCAFRDDSSLRTDQLAKVDPPVAAYGGKITLDCRLALAPRPVSGVFTGGMSTLRLTSKSRTVPNPRERRHVHVQSAR